MAIRIGSISQHQSRSFYSSLQMRGYSVNNAVLKHYVHQQTSFVPIRDSKPRHYSKKLSREEQERIIRLHNEQQRRANFLPSPGTPAYQELRERVSDLIKQGGKDPGISLISVEESMKDPILGMPDGQVATKRDVQEIKSELQKIQAMVKKLGKELSRNKLVSDSANTHAFYSK